MAVMVVWLGVGAIGLYGRCVEKAGVGVMVVVFILFLVLPFLVFPFLRFVGEQCGACAAAGAVLHTGARVRGCGRSHGCKTGRGHGWGYA